jgi:UDP-N-acetyl-2-amino-2-deoxyglucuronate dehydrogenase
MPDSFGFAIVGCGMIARFHVRAIQEIPSARVSALVSRTALSGQKMIEETGIPPCPIFASTEEAVRSPGVDAIIVTTPSGAHLQPALAAAAAGKHIIVEKPLEITGPRCQQIIDACDKAGVRLCTIFPSRFGDANTALKSAVDSGKFGRITLGETTCKWWRTQQYYDDGGWKGTQALDGGGALMNQAIHNVDLLLWMMGSAALVSGFTATLAHERIEVEDTAVAVIRFKSGALGVIQATTSVHPGYPKTISIHGDRGSAAIEQDDVLRWDFTPETEADLAMKARFSTKASASGGSADPKAISHEGHRRQLADFIEAVRSKRPPKVDGKEGKKAVDLICAIYESNRTGKAVEVPK